VLVEDCPETYTAMKHIIDLTKFNDDKWQICCDLKVVSLLFGLQTGFTSHMCIYCHWNSRDVNKVWEKKFTKRTTGNTTLGEKNFVESNPAIGTQDIDLGCMYTLGSRIYKRGNIKFVPFLMNKLKLTEAKAKSAILNGREIDRLRDDLQFRAILDDDETKAWDAFLEVKSQVLGSVRASNWRFLVNSMIKSFVDIGCNCSYKMHILNTHLDRFAPNSGDYSDEQGELNHQLFGRFSKRFNGNLTVNALGDFNFNQAKHDGTKYKRKSITQQRKDKRKRYREDKVNRVANSSRNLRNKH